MNLSQIARKYPTDKHGHHDYCPIYERYLESLRKNRIVLLELGIGGYEGAVGGGSLQMFEEYFPYASIHGVDIYDKKRLDRGRVLTHKGNQTDEEFLHSLVKKIGNPDVVIDDASHINSFTIKSFEILFPLLKSKGFYFIEDTHTSYWEEISSDGTNFEGGNHPNTVMNYFKRLTEALNYPHSAKVGVGESNIGLSAYSIHFYKEIIVIMKK